MTDQKEPTSVPLNETTVDKDKKIEKTVVKKKFNGVVVGDKMDKTIIVRVDRIKKDKKYGKRYTASRKYKVHDSKNQFKTDDKVNFIECRPLSKDKRWRVIYDTK